MRFFKPVVTVLVLIFLGLQANLCIGQQSQAEDPEPVLSSMLTDLAQCDAHSEEVNLRAVSTMLEAARRLDESNSESILLLADCLEALGDGLGAAEALGSYVALVPENEVALARIISLNLETLQTSEERRGYLSSLAMRVGIPDGVRGVIFQELSRLNFEAANEDAGWALVNQAAAADAYNLGARQQMLEHPKVWGNVFQRVQSLTQLVRINPLRVQVVWNFANALDELGLHLEAQKWYKYALGVHLAGASGSEITADKWLDWASSYVLSQDYEKALLVLDRLVKEYPKQVNIRIWLSRAEAGRGQKQQAENQLAVAEELLLGQSQQAPSDVRAVSQVAWFYLQDKSDKDKALEWSNKAIRLDAENSQAQLCMGLALLANGQIASSQAQLEPLAEHDAWARLGLIRAMLAGEHTKEAAQQAVQGALAQHPGGWVGLALRELAQTQEIPIDMSIFLESIHQAIDAELGNAAELRDFYRHPKDYLLLKILPSKSDYDYRDPIMLNISLSNLGSTVITMGPGMMLNPQVIMSVLLSGALQRELKHDFVSLYKKRRMNPGQGLSTSVRLDRGELRDVLRQCPQETITIKVSCILDPQVVGENEYLPSLVGQASNEEVVRYGFRPSREAMGRLYRVLKEGSVRSKIRTAMLLGDLLGNSQNPQAIAEAKKPRAVNEEQITTALVATSQDADWRVRAWLGEALEFVRLNGQLSKTLADQIQDPHWFVRLMAVRAAGSRGQNWREILRRVAETDKDPLVRQMASIYVSDGAAAKDE